MKKKGTIAIVSALGLGFCAYALRQPAPVKEEKKNQVQYLQEIKLRKPQGPVRKKKLLIRLIPRKIRRQNRSLSKLRMMVL